MAAIASLDEPVRRGLYCYVARQRRDVGRGEAARALRISRALAAFHLDKLVRQGLLDTSYRRLTGRRGPGAGRPAKLYRRSAHQLDLTLPRRRYELAGRMLAQALTEARSPAAVRALRRAARNLGRSLGADASRGRRGAGTARGPLARLLPVLEWCGTRTVSFRFFRLTTRDARGSVSRGARSGGRESAATREASDPRIPGS